MDEELKDKLGEYLYHERRGKIRGEHDLAGDILWFIGKVGYVVVKKEDMDKCYICGGRFAHEDWCSKP